MASGDTLFAFFPSGNLPPTASFATLDTFAGATGVRLVLDFRGDTGDETAIFEGYFPAHYAGGGVNVVIDYSTDGTDADAIEFEVSIESLQDNDDQDAGGADFGSATNIADTPQTNTANFLNRTAAGAITHTNCGSPSIGDRMRLKVTRDYDHAANADDVQLHGVYVTET